MEKQLIRKIYDSVGADAVVVTQDDLRLYLTGFSSTFGVIVIDSDGASFYTDSRYLEAAKAQIPDLFSVKEYPKKTRLAELLKGYKSLGIDFGKTFAEDYISLKDFGYVLKDSSAALRKAMSVKSERELKNITLACNAADKAFCELIPSIKEGMTENECAALLEYLMRKHGASGVSFETICAFGANGSVPHHETGAAKLKFGDIVLVDFGCKVNGYCSDCTRTFLFGDDKNHEDFKNAYSRVLEAHMLVKDKFKAGMKGSEGDAIARDYLKAFNLDRYFTHSLGHSLGVNIHEYPNLSPACDEIFTDGMVFSDEPGVYFEGKFGIRIEDTVCLRGGSVVSLTNTDKNLIIL